MALSLHSIASSVARRLPSELRFWIRGHVPTTEMELRRREAADPFFREPPNFDGPGSPVRLGIIREFCHYHRHYIAACRELGVSYRLLDISANDWVPQFLDARCAAFLVWPSVSIRAWREMFDERLRILEQDLRMIVYPGYHETWLYENKRRVHAWLLAKGIPHPRTWVFFERGPAQDFARTVDLPIVVKTNLGAAHSGVWIIRHRADLQRMINRAFTNGLLARGRHRSEGEAGCILLQHFLRNVREWRMVRIGDSYFGHPKGRVGDFHSGSGKVEWTPPEARHLDFLKQVTDEGDFTSMDVDMFETEEGELLVNELQTVFGAGFSVDQARINEKAGRFVWAGQPAHWQFEVGDFARNACANARVNYLVSRLLNENKLK